MNQNKRHSRHVLTTDLSSSEMSSASGVGDTDDAVIMETVLDMLLHDKPASQGEIEKTSERVAAAESEAAAVNDLLMATDSQGDEQNFADWAAAPSGTSAPDASSDESSSSPPTQHCKTTCWWAPILKQHVKENGVVLHPEPGLAPRTLLSACSGSCAEAEVMKASWLGLAAGCWLPGWPWFGMECQCSVVYCSTVQCNAVMML